MQEKYSVVVLEIIKIYVDSGAVNAQEVLKSGIDKVIFD